MKQLRKQIETKSKQNINAICNKSATTKQRTSAENTLMMVGKQCMKSWGIYRWMSVFIHIDERSDNGDYKAKSHAATRHYKSETRSRGKKIFFQHRSSKNNAATHWPLQSTKVTSMPRKAQSISKWDWRGKSGNCLNNV